LETIKEVAVRKDLFMTKNRQPDQLDGGFCQELILTLAMGNPVSLDITETGKSKIPG